MKWIKVGDALPNVEPADGFGEYYESELVLVAFKDCGQIKYEVAKLTQVRESEGEDFGNAWYVPQAEDVVFNVVAWMAFDKCTDALI